MKEQDFPGLYLAADRLSKDSQTTFFNALGAHLLLLIVAAGLSMVSISDKTVAVAQVFVLLGALFCSIYLFSKRPDRSWYSGRAVAESIKTITWRYVAKAEPFLLEDGKAKTLFRKKLQAVVDQNKDIANKLVTHLEAPQITDVMKELRALSLVERKNAYAQHRIADQLKWYASKAGFNAKASWWAFTILVVINAVAVFVAIAKIAYGDIAFWPTDVLVAIAASLLSWMQAKRFTELSASYALTAHEIGIIREQVDQEMDDEAFSLFVGDAENAFSREHTQWVARKDS